MLIQYEVDGVKKVVPHCLIEEVIWGTHPGSSTLDYNDLEGLFEKYPTTPDHPTFDNPIISLIAYYLEKTKGTSASNVRRD